jgi:proteic killer suppression protein
MTRRVELTRRAEKQARRLPEHVRKKLWTWAHLVTEIGLEEARKIPGFHDEPLVGPRRGTRSIRLSRGYRAIYRLVRSEDLELISVEEVGKHGY